MEEISLDGMPVSVRWLEGFTSKAERMASELGFISLQQMLTTAALNFALTWAMTHENGGYLKLTKNDVSRRYNLRMTLPPVEPGKVAECMFKIPLNLFDFYMYVKNQSGDTDDSVLVHKIIIMYLAVATRVVNGWALAQVFDEMEHPIEVFRTPV